MKKTKNRKFTCRRCRCQVYIAWEISQQPVDLCSRCFSGWRITGRMVEKSPTTNQAEFPRTCEKCRRRIPLNQKIVYCNWKIYCVPCARQEKYCGSLVWLIITGLVGGLFLIIHFAYFRN